MIIFLPANPWNLPAKNCKLSSSRGFFQNLASLSSLCIMINVLIFYCSREKSYCISHSLAPNQPSKALYQPSHDIMLKTLQNSNLLSHAHNSTNLVSSSLFKSLILTMFFLGLLIFYSDVSFNFGYSNLLRKDTSIFMIISLFGPMPYSHRTSTAEHHKGSSNDLFSFIYSSSI